MEDGRPLEPWMSFNPSDLQVRGTAPNNIIDRINVIIKARDQFGGEASTLMTVNIR